ncbi:MAG: AprI/Inh family metalloprotease inhibitor [Phreatobacter sp.]|uniref:AprI/Inh family metalloprotease inhibitor n=1 Tax=Phreatobacter sp. TaxID=1966341 RepID=UPI002735D477|nr:AprI/Inh family metalloprotease inhibitor [Phreatobacter sp.]MDP2802962.1 AprI/Inh family metalloprotease inhibitor [Phreatobacter sp.]
MGMRPAAALFLCSVALAGCTSSSRFGDSGGSPVGWGRSDTMARTEVQPQIRPAPSDDVIPGGQPGASGAVESQEIAPPSVSGRSDTGPPAVETALAPSSPSAQPQIMQPEPQRGAPQSPPTVVSALPRQERAASGATSVAGTWTVTDAGDRCRITLTSTPLFEFYRASPQNCRAPTLARINAWEQRGAEIVLLQPGGRVAARLSPQGGGAYSGATATGAPVSMAR